MQNRRLATADLPSKPTLLKPLATPHRAAWGAPHLLFWSGGKDSYLTLLDLEARDVEPITLLTTFDPVTGLVPEQNVPMSSIFEQARHLQRPLVVVPTQGAEYHKDVLQGVQIATESFKGERPVLCFGDLHLQDIRDWRVRTFADFECVFPIFGCSYMDLAERLFSNTYNKYGAQYFVSAATGPKELKEFIQPGREYTSELVRDVLLSNEDGVDAFGENGEFHTLVVFPEAKKRPLT